MALLAAVIATLAVGAPGKPSTALTFVALNQSVGRAVFHLECHPAGGDIADAARACAAIHREPELVTHPKPFTCAGATFSWWDITIRGRLDGRPIRTRTSTCWTSQMEMIRRLGIGWQSLRRHLVPRRRGVVGAGLTRTFLPDQLRPADFVICTILGHKLMTGVPLMVGSSSTGYGGRNVVSVTLRVTLNRDRSVTASCHKGTY